MNQIIIYLNPLRINMQTYVFLENRIFQQALNYLQYIDKLENDFTPHEILSKSLSLAGKMEPFSDLGNKKILNEAGFNDIEIIFKHINFQGYLCIK